MPSLRVAIVGCGALAQLYYAKALRALSGSLGLSVNYLIDPDPSRRAILEGNFPGSRGVPSLEEIPEGSVDLGIVASPQAYHAVHSIRLTELGAHVLCEKPMASTVQEAVEMVSAAERHDRLLSVGLFRRFFPSSEYVKQLVTGGALGAVRSIRWVEGGVFNWPAASPSFFQKSASQGGVFADVGAHVVDLILWWLGEPESIRYWDDAMGGLEANARAVFRYSTGLEATIRLSRDTPVRNGTTIEFEKGSVYFEGASAENLQLRLVGVDYSADAVLMSASASRSTRREPARSYAQSFMEQVSNLCSAARSNADLVVPGRDAIRSMRLLQRCYEAREPMPMPWLSRSEIEGIASVERTRT